MAGCLTAVVEHLQTFAYRPGIGRSGTELVVDLVGIDHDDFHRIGRGAVEIGDTRCLRGILRQGDDDHVGCLGRGVDILV